MTTRQEYLKALDIVKEYRKQCNEDLKVINEVFKPDELKETLIAKSGLSQTSINALNRYSEALLMDKRVGIYFRQSHSDKYAKVKDLAKVSEYHLINCRGIGKFILNDIKALCSQAGIKLLP